MPRRPLVLQRAALATLLACLAACSTIGPAAPTPTPTAAIGESASPLPLAPTLGGAEVPAGIPTAAWSRAIGLPYDGAGHPSVTYPMIDDGPWAGVPLGGLGAGSIGRTYRGDFARWHLDLGSHRFETTVPNQFSVYVEQGGHRQAHVLSPLRPDTLTSWNWDMPVGAGTYFGLFPRAWFVYDWPVLPVELTQQQFSPVIPGNYQESSYPVGVFVWTVTNPTDAPLTLGLLFTWQNLVGRDWGQDGRGGHVNRAVRSDDLTGVVLTRPHSGALEEWDGSFVIATPSRKGLRTSYRSRFDIQDGADLWQDFAADGTLDDTDDPTPAEPGQAIGAGLAVTLMLQPGETREVPFALAWDFPITEFGSGTQWAKRYTRFYGSSGEAAWDMAADALASYPKWEAAIESWQAPILADPDRPDWYKTALFNELYYLVDGGTVWENGQAGQELSDGVGRFAYLETFDYPFYNTVDVHFYASFALVQLWPELETQIIRDIAAVVPLDLAGEMITIQSTGQAARRHLPGSVPHDLGSPGEDPWLRPNAYVWRNVAIWKDLNSKFVLEAWRDYVYTGDRTLLEDTWPSMVLALDYLRDFDRDGDGLPDHDGVPDQTYDNWVMTGAGAYSGSLWLAALEAAIETAGILEDSRAQVRYQGWLEAGRAAFESLLWNGSYYNFDTGRGPTSDSIMADQLAGAWYAEAAGLPAFLPEEHVLSALSTIYARNVRGFAMGQKGAVNGARPNGMVDRSSEQSQEVWTGTTYALAAFMLQHGLTEQAWATAWGIYNVTYQHGMWYRTPEAWLENGDYRASMYMRPLSIWAIEAALAR